MHKRLEKQSLRFPEFREPWRTQKLGKFLVERIDYSTENLPLYSLTIENGIVPKTERYERSFLVKSIEGAYKKTLPDDFAYNPMNLRFGALARHKGNTEVSVSKYYNIFYCNEDLDSAFAELYLTSYNLIQYYDKMSTGSLEEKKRVHYSDFVNFKLPFPSLPEQQKIADFLTTIDTRLRQLREKAEHLRTYKKGVMQQLFSQQIRFKAEDGDWETHEFQDIADRIKTKFDPKKSKINYPCIELESIKQQDGIILKTFSSNDQKSTKTKFKKGDVLFGKLRPYLRKYIYANFEGVCSSEIWVFRGKKASNKYLYYLIQSNRFNKVANISSGSKMPRSDWDLVSSFVFKIPSHTEQQKIADFLTALDERIQSLEAQIERTEAFKRGLLQRMFVQWVRSAFGARCGVRGLENF